MKASTSRSTAIAAAIAFHTNEERVSGQVFSKVYAIAQSKTCVGSILCPFLIRTISRNILPGAYRESHSTTIGLGRESTDLINLREILRASGEENISRDAFLTPTCDRKSKARVPGRTPFHGCSRESAARSCQPN